MFGVKVLLGTAALCSGLLAVLFVWNSDAIISNVGEFFYKMYTILFVLSSIVLTKEAVSINVEEKYK